MMIYLAIVILGTFAGFVSGIIGTGGSIILLPILSWRFGPQVAVPIMAVASIMSNLSRVIIWRKEINWRACFAYSALAIPGAVLGANTLWHLPPQMSDICIGAFFLILVPLMAWSRKHNLRLNIGLLATCGLIVGFLTGMVFSTGPMTVPLFAGFGLVKQGLIATESAASLIVFVTKTSTFAAIGALPPSVVFSGIFVGASQIAGIFLSKGLVARMPTRLFHLLVAGMMIVAGISMVWNGINSLS